MNRQQAEEALEDAELVPCLEAPIPDAKRLVDTCLGADIPAMLGGRPDCKKGGCAPKALLLVRADDVPRVAKLLANEWRQMAIAEGTVDDFELGAPSEADPDAEPACPACGTAAPLTDGACSDCGLALG